MLELEYWLEALNLRLNKNHPGRHVEGTGQCSSKVDLGEKVRMCGRGLSARIRGGILYDGYRRASEGHTGRMRGRGNEEKGVGV